MILIWALFVSPKAKIEASPPVRFAIELAVWIAAGVALHAAGQSRLAVGFVTLAALSGLLNAASR